MKSYFPPHLYPLPQGERKTNFPLTPACGGIFDCVLSPRGRGKAGLDHRRGGIFNKSSNYDSGAEKGFGGYDFSELSRIILKTVRS
jgi:hypothetical protein